jgi:hypothetical protein
MPNAPKSTDLVVFDILRASKCAGCGDELSKGSLLFMEKERPLCLSCADLDHLVYLSRGDAALTHRAKKHSTLSAVVVVSAERAADTSARASWWKRLRFSRLKKNALRMLNSALPSKHGMRCAAPRLTAISKYRWQTRF